MSPSRRGVVLLGLTATAAAAAAAVVVVSGAPLAGSPSDYTRDVANSVLASLPDWATDRLTGSGFFTAFAQSFLMILVTEAGDKTFFIAALLSMRFSRGAVLGGALSALAIMTVLSAALGKTFPLLFDAKYTSMAAAVLFAYFGVALLRDWWRMRVPGQESGELAEVEEELTGADGESAPGSGGGGSGSGSVAASGSGVPMKKRAQSVLFALVSPVFVRAFSLTFVAEWGDRSQIATIALAAAKNVYGVTLGGIAGHTVCTSIAVVGGRLLAASISERAVALIGGLLFLLFSVLTAFGKLE